MPTTTASLMLKLYQVYVGGATYWMSLWAIEPPLEAAWNLLVAAGDDEERPSSSVELDASTKVHITLDGTGPNGESARVSLWLLHQTATKPCIHGCSEWP